MGWYAMALVDVLEFIPQHEAGRDSLLDILNNVAVQVEEFQDPKTGGWYQVMDRSGDKGNYVESSCSAMFIYSLFKAVRLGYIDKSYLDVALKGYKGFLDNFIEVDNNGLVTASPRLVQWQDWEERSIVPVIMTIILMKLSAITILKP